MNVTIFLLERRHRLCASIAVTMGLLLLTIPIAHATTFGSAIRITTNAGWSQNPSVVAFWNYVYAAWDDDTPVSGSGTASEIWMRVSSNNGASFGSAKRISTNTGQSLFPSVAVCVNNVYVAWQDNTPVLNSEQSYEIWMRASSNYGASFGSPIRISYNAYASEYPSVATDGYGHVYVAWADWTHVTGSGTKPEIWMRVSSNSGTSFGSPIRISTNTYTSEYPSVATDGSGHVYVAWQDDTPVSGSGTKPEIWMRVSSNNGASFGSAVRISTNTGESADPSVAASGSYVYVAWQDDTPVTGSGTKPEIWMRVSSNNGASFGSAIRITTNTGSSTVPSVAAADSLVNVAWQDDTPVTGSGTLGYPEIWMRAGSNHGASFDSAIRITTNTGTSENPSVATTLVYVCVAWDDYTPVPGGGSASEIWMRVGS